MVKELERISRSKSKSAINAKVALKLIELRNIEVFKTREKIVDKAILSFANKDTIVATNDSKLRKKLKSKGIKTIYLRAKKHLAIS